MEQSKWKVTPLWKVVINWYGEEWVVYRHAPTARSALALGCREVERKKGLEMGVVLRRVDGSDRYRVEKVREGREEVRR